MKRIILLYLSAAFLFTSCAKDYLETRPTNAVSDAVIFTNTNDAWKAIEGMHRFLYRQMYGTQALGGISGNMIYMDALGEDLVMTGQSNGWFINEYRWINHRLDNSTICFYNYLYFFSFISNANQVLAQIEGATGPQADKNAIKGQAFAYRGWAYFMMIQLFGERFVKGQANNGLGLPLRTEPTVGATPRVSVAEIYTQINKDLDSAITRLSANPVTTRRDKSHININVAKGFKARVALAQQEWALAAQLAAEARQGFELMTNAEYMGGFNNYTNREWIWGIRQQEDQGTFFFSFFAYMSANFNSTNIRTNPKAINRLLYDQITNTDVRKGLWDPTGTNTSFPIPLSPNGSRFPFMNRKFLVANTALSIGDVPLMRAAEMLLIEAEARARNNQDAQAQDALFILARQRDPSYVKSTLTGTALINEIMTQRRVELWGEGFRFYDLKRLNLPLDRSGANHNASLAGVFQVPSGSDLRWQFLIPLSEINNTNGVVVQNPL